MWRGGLWVDLAKQFEIYNFRLIEPKNKKNIEHMALDIWKEAKPDFNRRLIAVALIAATWVGLCLQQTLRLMHIYLSASAHYLRKGN